MNALILLFSLLISCQPKQIELVPLTEPQQKEAAALFTRHVMAIGGKQALESHSAMIVRGTLEEIGSGKQSTFSIQRKQPNFYYIQINLLEMGIYERGFDGENFWERTPRSARMLPVEEVQLLAPSLDFYFDANWQKWYPKFIYREVGEFGGERCDILTVENHLGKREKIFFSQSTGLKIGQVKNVGENPETIIRFGQYLPKDNVQVPMYIEEKQGELHKLWRITDFTWDRADVDFRPPPILMEDR